MRDRLALGRIEPCEEIVDEGFGHGPRIRSGSEAMGLTDDVRQHCAAIAARARWVAIDTDRLDAYDLDGPPPLPAALDAERHFLEGSRDEVATYMLVLDAINFGSGWFPLLRKREVGGLPIGGYYTVSWALADHVRRAGVPSNAQLRGMTTDRMAAVLGQDPSLELISLYAQAARELGRFLAERSPLEVILGAAGSAERLATTLADGMAMFADPGFSKRAQIVPSDLALAGVAEFSDLDRLTIFADNLVPHVLRCDGVLRYRADLADHIDAGRPLPSDEREREIRASAVHACELIARRLRVAPRTLDAWLWNRGQDARYKARPRHRTRTVFY